MPRGQRADRHAADAGRMTAFLAAACASIDQPAAPDNGLNGIGSRTVAGDHARRDDHAVAACACRGACSCCMLLLPQSQASPPRHCLPRQLSRCCSSRHLAPAVPPGADIVAPTTHLTSSDAAAHRRRNEQVSAAAAVAQPPAEPLPRSRRSDPAAATGTRARARPTPSPSPPAPATRPAQLHARRARRPRASRQPGAGRGALDGLASASPAAPAPLIPPRPVAGMRDQSRAGLPGNRPAPRRSKGA